MSALAAVAIVAFADSPSDASYAPVAGCAAASANDYSCYRARLQRVVRASGARSAFTELKSVARGSDPVKSNCHQLTHDIGRAAAERYGDVPRTYAHGDALCSSGYYHGAMQVLAAKMGARRFLAEINSVCVAPNGDHGRPFPHFECSHGLGHGLMGLLGNELFRSLAACDALKDSWKRGNCHGGVFMENTLVARANPKRRSRYLDPRRPLYPCTAVAARYRRQCFLEQTQYALEVSHNDVPGLFGLCAEVRDSSREACYEGVGAGTGALSIRQNITDEGRWTSVSGLCALARSHEAHSSCVVGAVKGFVLHYQSRGPPRAFCDSLERTYLRRPCVEAADRAGALEHGR